MKSLLPSFVLLLLSSFLIFTSCYNGEKVVDGMANVTKGAVVLKSFYQESNRLPNDNTELIKFSEEKNMSLDLSEFSKFDYYLSSDSTITIDFEMKSSQENKGSFSIDI